MRLSDTTSQPASDSKQGSARFHGMSQRELAVLLQNSSQRGLHGRSLISNNSTRKSKRQSGLLWLAQHKVCDRNVFEEDRVLPCCVCVCRDASCAGRYGDVSSLELEVSSRDQIAQAQDMGMWTSLRTSSICLRRSLAIVLMKLDEGRTCPRVCQREFSSRKLDF